ncbi:hypothetical protein LJB42_004617 [Komagataella kurtzmanii]|nr:hypothetical protein LJB42_004617 [Komagataella kurtzmanii]
MDVEVLHSCFVGTLQADEGIRANAEGQLKELEKKFGFLGACLDILNEEGVSTDTKRACVTYFKNRIVKNWGNSQAIDHDERPIIRERLVQGLINNERFVKNMLFPALSTILAYDYPKSWPEFLPLTINLLNDTANQNAVFAGIVCLSEICRSYRWSENATRSSSMDPIIMKTFPGILNIANSLLEVDTDTVLVGEMLKLILKCYKFATYYDLPEPLRTETSIYGWGTLHVRIIQKQLPASVMAKDENERVRSPYVKAQKWGFNNLTRVFTRYASNNLSQKFDYPEFKTVFINHFAPELIKTYFQIIGQWREGSKWLSPACLYGLVEFIEYCIPQKDTWRLIKPSVNDLIAHFAYPLLIPSDSLLELFESDPYEYIHMILNVYDSTTSPAMAVVSLLYTLLQKRSKSCLELVMQFIYEKLTSLEDDNSLEGAKQREGAFRLLGAIAHKLVKRNCVFYPQIEQFLATFVFPYFNSPYGFLNARTCEVATKFDGLEFQNKENLATLYRGVVNCFQNETDLPVQLEGALGIQTFIDAPEFKEALEPIILPTMQKLLNLSNIMETDTISAVIQNLVENYAEQLQPFGLELMNKLTEQLSRLLVEIETSTEQDDNTEKEMVVLGTLNTIITVLLSFENSKETILQLEQSFYPAIEYCLKNGMQDFFTEVAELIENSTFLTRSISPLMWQIFELVMNTFENGTGKFYLSDFVPALKNYLTFGADVFKKNAHYNNAMMKLIISSFEDALDNNDLDEEQLSIACNLDFTFVLCLGEDSKPFLPTLLKTTIAMSNLKVRTYECKVFLNNVVLACFVHDIQGTLQSLLESQTLYPLLTHWFDLSQHLFRVFDLKLSLIAAMSIINLPRDFLIQTKLDSLLPNFGLMISSLLRKLPDAIMNLTKQREEYDETLLASASSKAEDEFLQEPEGDDDDDHPDVVLKDDYLQFLQTAQSKDDVDEFTMVDDPLTTTPLDSVDVFGIFKQVFTGISNNDSLKKDLFSQKLSREDQEVIQSVLEVTK